jgi:hypothetical protein
MTPAVGDDVCPSIPSALEDQGAFRCWFPDSYPETRDMPLSEFLGVVLTAGGPVALVVVALRFSPDACLWLMAGTVAVLTPDAKRSERCLSFLRIFRNRRRSTP